MAKRELTHLILILFGLLIVDYAWGSNLEREVPIRQDVEIKQFDDIKLGMTERELLRVKPNFHSEFGIPLYFEELGVGEIRDAVYQISNGKLRAVTVIEKLDVANYEPSLSNKLKVLVGKYGNKFKLIQKEILKPKKSAVLILLWEHSDRNVAVDFLALESDKEVLNGPIIHLAIFEKDMPLDKVFIRGGPVSEAFDIKRTLRLIEHLMKERTRAASQLPPSDDRTDRAK